MTRFPRLRAAAALIVLGVVPMLAAACAGPSTAGTWHAGSGSAGPSAAASPSGSPSPTGRPVHVRLYESDGSTYGVGMPIIAYLSAKITDARAFAAATQVTVNGSPAQGAWYFEKSWSTLICSSLPFCTSSS